MNKIVTINFVTSLYTILLVMQQERIRTNAGRGRACNSHIDINVQGILSVEPYYK